MAVAKGLTAKNHMKLPCLNRIEFPTVEFIPLLIVAAFFSSFSFDIDGDVVHVIDREGLFWVAIQRTSGGVIASAILGAIPLVIRLTHGMAAFAPKLASRWGWGALMGVAAMPALMYTAGLLDDCYYGTYHEYCTSQFRDTAFMACLIFLPLSALAQAVIVFLRDRPLFWGLLVYSLAFYAVIFAVVFTWMYHVVLPHDYDMWMRMR